MAVNKTLQVTEKKRSQNNSLENSSVSLSTKEALVHRLQSGLNRYFGIHCNGQETKKMVRAFSSMDDSRLSNWVRHMECLHSDHPEWYSLVESLTVHETYFVRDTKMLEMFYKDIMPAVIAKKKKAGDYSIQIWSAGCSTGEETYDISRLVLQAMLDAGEAYESSNGDVTIGSRWTLDILGTDLSNQVLSVAKEGAYTTSGMGSFRRTSLAWNKKYFEKKFKFCHVKPFLRRHVRFLRHNLVSGLPPVVNSDVVVCRNVLIYFHDVGKRKAQKTFANALVPSGTLILGPADSLLIPERFNMVCGDGAVMYTKKIP